MSMLSELKKEHKKISVEKIACDRKLKALESTMKEYGIRLHPGAVVLSDLIIECLQEYGGRAKYKAIADCLYDHGVEVTRTEISQALHNHSGISFDREKGEWRLLDAPASNAAPTQPALTG